MPNSFTCPYCGAFVTTERAVGATITCTQESCGRDITVPPAPPRTALPGVDPLAMAPVPTSKLAVAGLVCGILGVFTLCIGVGGCFGLMALVLAGLGLRRISRSGGALTGRNLGMAGLVLGIVVLLLSLVAIGVLMKRGIPVYEKWQQSQVESREHQACEDQLQALHEKLVLYRDVHHAYPESLDTLASGGFLKDMTAELRCPAVKPRQPIEPSSAGDYIYYGDATAVMGNEYYVVVAHDRPGNHPFHLINVLFLDGHVDSISAADDNWQDDGRYYGWIFPGDPQPVGDEATPAEPTTNESATDQPMDLPTPPGDTSAL